MSSAVDGGCIAIFETVVCIVRLTGFHDGLPEALHAFDAAFRNGVRNRPRLRVLCVHGSSILSESAVAVMQRDGIQTTSQSALDQECSFLMLCTIVLLVKLVFRRFSR